MATWPARRGTFSPIFHPRARPPAPCSPPRQNPVDMRLLVVEDEAKRRALLRRGLGEARFDVDLAERGEDARWLAKPAPYAALALDVMRPGIDGLEPCRGLRAQQLGSPAMT